MGRQASSPFSHRSCPARIGEAGASAATSFRLHAYGRQQGGRGRRMQSRGPPKNAEIRVSDVRVIGTNKESLGVMPTRQALDIAADEDLDLVLVVPDADPPVARIVNYGKFMYEQDKKKKEAKKGQSKAKSAVKELKMRPNTDVADYNVRLKRALNFLAKGNKVKVTVVFQGRDIAFKDNGRNLLERFQNDVGENGQVEGKPSMQGRQMIMYFTPPSK